MNTIEKFTEKRLAETRATRRAKEIEKNSRSTELRLCSLRQDGIEASGFVQWDATPLVGKCLADHRETLLDAVYLAFAMLRTDTTDEEIVLGPVAFFYARRLPQFVFSRKVVRIGRYIYVGQIEKADVYIDPFMGNLEFNVLRAYKWVTCRICNPVMCAIDPVPDPCDVSQVKEWLEKLRGDDNEGPVLQAAPN